MEGIVFVGALLLFAASVGILLYVRIGFVQYTTQLMNCLDAVLSGEKEIDFQEDQDTLNGKMQTKIRQLYEIMELKTEENCRQRQQLEAMISDISHQVKTPIASIRMYHDLLERKELAEEKREEFMFAVEHQVDKLEFFMNSMIRMSRLETGIVQVRPVRNPVYELVAQAVCREYVNRIISLLHLEEKLENLPNNLSGGQQQRVAIARALASKPAIILADEPTGNLDSKTSLEVMQLLKMTSAEFGQTLLMITHNPELAQIADSVIRIEDGKIVE